jgi:hypothetical protein
VADEDERTRRLLRLDRDRLGMVRQYGSRRSSGSDGTVTKNPRARSSSATNVHVNGPTSGLWTSTNVPTDPGLLTAHARKGGRF